jgi:hypothetical protein
MTEPTMHHHESRRDETVFHPVSDIHFNQLVVEWVPRDTLFPNSYNPNRMTWTARNLLKVSVIEDGWTQPIVVLPNRTIVDGEQRWAVSGMPLDRLEIEQALQRVLDTDDAGPMKLRLEAALAKIDRLADAGEEIAIASLTDGLVPITVVDFRDEAHQIISTIRHNRASGVHELGRVIAIAEDLTRLGLKPADLQYRLGLGDEEVGRFLSLTTAVQRAAEEYTKAWVPVPLNPDLSAGAESCTTGTTSEVEEMRSRMVREIAGQRGVKTPLGLTTEAGGERVHRFLAFISLAQEEMVSAVAEAMALSIPDCYMALVDEYLAHRAPQGA